MPAVETLSLPQVLVVRTARGEAAAFVLDRSRRRWLVTASHVVPDDPTFEIDLLLATGRASTTLSRLPVVAGAADIAVFPLEPSLVEQGSSPEASNSGLRMGQDVYLFGFPLIGYGSWRTDTGGALPFVRKGCMGGTMSIDGTRTILVDAISDVGMSGGPATFSHGRSGRPHLAGVIIDPDVDVVRGEGETLRRFPFGITQVVSIDHVTETIDRSSG